MDFAEAVTALHGRAMDFAEAVTALHGALEKHPTDEVVPVPMDALCAVLNRADGDVGFTDEEAELIASFSGLPLSKVRGVETLLRMKVSR